MIEGVSSSLIQGLSAVGLLVLILIGVLKAFQKGLIYVRPQIDELLKVHEERVKDAKEREGQWRDVAEKWQTTAQEAISNNDADLQQGKTIIALLESVRAAQRNPRR